MTAMVKHSWRYHGGRIGHHVDAPNWIKTFGYDATAPSGRASVRVLIPGCLVDSNGQPGTFVATIKTNGQKTQILKIEFQPEFQEL